MYFYAAFLIMAIILGFGSLLLILRSQMIMHTYRNTVITSKGMAINRLIAPALIPVFIGSIAAGLHSGYELGNLQDIKATSDNINMIHTKFDLAKISDAYPDLKISKADTTYTASGDRTTFHSDQTSRYSPEIENITPTAAQQFVINTKQGNLKTVEISGNAVKVMKDLDPNGSTKPYYETTSCTWKNEAVTKDCPIKTHELHLYSNNTEYNKLVTDQPENTNDSEEDPLVAQAIKDTGSSEE